jgi:formylglycine-generating enzyme required for sulfatase activity
MSAARRLLSAAALTGLAAAALPRGPAAPAPAERKQFTNSVGMRMVRIPAGKFLMGSPPGEAGRRDEEFQHEVEISRRFYLGAYEVTQQQYQKVMGVNPSHFSATGPDRVRGLDTSKFPVEGVSWSQAVEFCSKLSARPGEKGARRVYRLPTEAEWEYACRAGAKEYAPLHFGKSLSSAQANFDGNSPYGGAPRGPALNRPTAVGSYKPNAWGLYDMHGNVWEWCADWYSATYYRRSPAKDPRGPDSGGHRVARGGGWNIDGAWCRSAYRGWTNHNVGHHHIGFRVACDVGGRRR